MDEKWTGEQGSKKPYGHPLNTVPLRVAHTAAFKLGGLFDILALFSISMVNP